MNVIALTIIASWITMTISLAIANFPTVYAREMDLWGHRHEALSEAKFITGLFTIFPVGWLFYLPAPTIARLVRSVTEDRVPE